VLLLVLIAERIEPLHYNDNVLLARDLEGVHRTVAQPCVDQIRDNNIL
jgi:hypothetical protein